MQAVEQHDQYLSEIYQNIRSGKVKKVSAISPEVKNALRAKLPTEQHNVLDFDATKINLLIRLGNEMSEEDFISFAKDPESVTAKLTPAEMESLRGGKCKVGWATGILGGASVIATVFSIGLSAGGCMGAIGIGITMDNCE